jgi:hypothetical protein
MLNSNYRPLCAVALPYDGRQMYMHTLDFATPSMPAGYEDYLGIVTALCESAGAARGIVHVTVDEKVVAARMSQRRPKPHVDGCFIPDRGVWGHDGGGWAHTCNNIPLGEFKRMPVIVASSAPGCRAWRGEFDGQPANDGDLSHLTLGEGEVLPAGVGYLLSADCVHESMIQERDVQRTFLRIALPTDFRF